MPLKNNMSVFMLLNSVFLLAMGSYFAFQYSSSTMVVSGVLILSSANVTMVQALRGLFGSVSKESDTDSV